jgi:hypothetical protein
MALLLKRDHPELYRRLEMQTEPNILENFEYTQEDNYLCSTFYKNKEQCNNNKNICEWNGEICTTKCLNYNNLYPHQIKVDKCLNDNNCIWSPRLAYNICHKKEPIKSIIYNLSIFN